MHDTIRVEAKDLASITGWAVRVIPSNPAIPVLRSIVLNYTPGTLSARGFDYDSATAAYVDAATGPDEPLEVAVPGRLLAAIAAKLDGTVTLEPGPRGLTLRAGRDRYTLPTLPVEEIPTHPEVGGTGGQVHAADLLHALAKVTTTIDPKATIPGAQFARFTSQDRKLMVTGVSRSAAARVWIPWDGDDCDFYVLPHQLRTVLAGTNGDLTLYQGKGLGIRGDGRDAVISLGAHEHPGNADSYFDVPHPTTISVETAALTSALDRLELVAIDKVPMMTLTVTDDHLTLTSARGMEDADISVPAEVTGPTGSIGMNPRLLHAVVGDFDTATITARFNPDQPSKQLLINAEDHVAVVVPMKLTGGTP